MNRVAVTGGIACGKSLFGSFLIEFGLPVLDADAVAHEVMRPEGPAYGCVVDLFGDVIVGSDGAIDRSKLGAIVFEDQASLKRLNHAVHPHVVRRIREWIERTEERQTRCAVALIPLLYEARMEADWHEVVCVVSRQNTQEERLLHRGMAREDAIRRIACQMPVLEKARLADYVVFNSGSKEMLRHQAKLIVDSLMKKEE